MGTPHDVVQDGSLVAQQDASVSWTLTSAPDSATAQGKHLPLSSLADLMYSSPLASRRVGR